MMEIAKHYRGLWGDAWELDLPPGTDIKGHIGAFFIHSPPSHPVWPQYLFTGVHLRPYEGQEKPTIYHFPGASHEFILMALNPEKGPWTPDNVVEKMLNGKQVFLTPFNIVEQIGDATDEQAITLMHAAARGMVDGILPLEPDDYIGGRDRWRTSLWRTLEHIKTGGHPSEN